MKFISRFFLKNSYPFGAFLGMVSPLFLMVIFYLLFRMLPVSAGTSASWFRNYFLLSLIGNLLLIRFYLVNKKFEKTGKAVLLVTFLLVIIYFVVT
jgi:hypothetical protein